MQLWKSPNNLPQFPHIWQGANLNNLTQPKQSKVTHNLGTSDLEIHLFQDTNKTLVLIFLVMDFHFLFRKYTPTTIIAKPVYFLFFLQFTLSLPVGSTRNACGFLFYLFSSKPNKAANVLIEPALMI